LLFSDIVIGHGQRAGKLRLSADKLIRDKDDQSKIPLEDYSIAIINELEEPKHIRKCFTVDY